MEQGLPPVELLGRGDARAEVSGKVRAREFRMSYGREVLTCGA